MTFAARFFPRTALAGIAALLLGGNAPQQVAPNPAPVAEIPADPALWVVRDRDTTIYLFGTVHALKPHLGWFDAAVRKAFDASQQIYFEIVLPSPDEAKAVIVPLAIDTSGKPLTEKLAPTDRPAYAAALARLGLPANALDSYEPWFAAVTLSQLSMQKAGFSAADGAEMTLDAAARAAHKPVAGLETMRQQLGYFHDLPEKDQIAFLMSGVKDLDRFGDIINAMLDKWKAGDAQGLSALMNEDLTSQPTLYKVLLVDRNKRWADWIDARLKTPGTVFVAVGAGHLAGQDSVQAQLAKHHLKAVRIRY